MPEAFIYDHVRSPRGRGRPNGALHEVTSLELATQVLKNIRERSDLDTTKVEDVILGCVMPVGEQGADIARIAALNADYAETTAGVQINRFCSSGLEAVNMAAAKVAAGEADLAIGGGIEMMSRVPLSSDGGAWPTDPTSAFKTYFVPQGISADLIATKFGFSRNDVDAYSVESQKRAGAAWANGYFKNSVMPVKDILGATLLDKDEHMRPETTMQTLAGLDPSFAAMGFMGGFDAVAIQRYPEIESINHVHTAGNSSGIVDGAAGVLVGSKKMARGIGKSPRARIVATASIGSEPTIMLTGPEWVAQKVLKKA
ncbi:MAG TPA: acetyl-CoA C-acetyltransferase, partial [Alphaproteobacteria bacterium]|nr:acetyl-CoA C-acetyltransferase [Alphaproteobacteria bacterium]